MQTLRHSIDIDRSLRDVYALARQVERYPEFLPGYLESRILERRGERLLLARAALLQGKVVRWKSWVDFDENKALAFEQVEGPLKGMRVQWDFLSKGKHKTQVTITHRYQISQPFLMGRLIEKYIYRPRLDSIACEVVKALKGVCEQKEEVLA